MSLDAMKQALEALDQVAGAMPFPVAESARKNLRLAIEQAERQEPWEQFYPDMGKPQLSHPAQPQQECPRCGKADPADIHTCTPKQEPVASLLEQNTMLDAKLAELERVSSQLLEALKTEELIYLHEKMPVPEYISAAIKAAKGEE
jgi:hypothetical protein